MRGVIVVTGQRYSVPLRATLAVALVLATMVGLFPAADRADAAVVRSFGKIFSQQTNGSIAITGNRLMTCGTSTACTQALNGTVSSSNNNFTMTFLDVDGDASTSNSSSADVVVPTGARVLYAGLFWGAARAAGSGGAAATGSANQLKFRTPSSTTYTTLTADTIDSSGLSTNDYSAYKDVTSLVQTGGSGTYWGADISAATGVDRYGAWSLVVAIGDPTAPLRDLTVFNGFATLTTSETVSTTISGFLAPPSGAVNAKFGTVVYEGDAGITGDYMTVNSTRLADAESPSANFFGSRVTSSGVNLTNRNPASVNNLGADAKVVDAPGVIPNGATSANVTFSTAGDFYYPAVLTTQIDLYAPTITGTKTVSNLSGNSPAKVGDTLEYTMAFTNSGDDNAINSVIEDSLPANTTYVPGSLQVLAGAGTGVKTDASGDDQAEYVAASRLVRYRVGTGATALTGGVLTNGGSTRVRFQVTVNTAAAGTTLSNSANLLYTAATLNLRYTYQTADVTTPVAALADLSLTKTGTPATATAGNTISYTLTASNSGPTAASDTQITDTLPSGATLVSTSPSQGACSASGQTLTCALGTVANGATATVTVVVRVPADSAVTSLTNVAEVSSSTSDPNTANNRASVTTSVTRSADVSLTKTASPSSPVPGNPVTYTLVATNGGASNAAGVVVTDTLPAAFGGLTATTTAGTCTVTGNGVSCAVGTLAAGASATVRITATLDAAYTGGSLTNAAQVQADTPDPVATNNTATATVTPTAAQADVRVVKETLTSPVVAGSPIQYRVTVSNLGPSVARGIVLNDPLTTGSYSGVTATTTAGSCSVTALTVNCPIGTLPSGSSATVVVNATVLSTATGVLTNRATATATTTDPVTANNSATVTDTVTTRADLSISKTATPTPVVDGDDATYTITVRNSGPSVSRNVIVTDPVPSPLTYVSSTSSQGTCTSSGSTVTCAVGNLASGATATITVVAAVPSAGGANGLTNTATVVADTPDPVSSNNSASYQLQTGASANLVMSKTASPATLTAGQGVTFTLTARNDGPSDAQGVRITDTVPAAVIGVAAATTTPGATCTVTGNAVSCLATTLADGASFVVTVTGTVTSTAIDGTLVNSASTTASTPDDPTTSDNTATSTSPVRTRADVRVTKTGPATVLAGNLITWSVTASNAGPSVADTVVVRDAFPAGVTYVSATGTGTTCSPQDQSSGGPLVACSLGSLSVGDSRTITFVGRVDADTATGTSLVNSVTVASATTDPSTANNSASFTTTTQTQADVSIAKSVTPNPLTAGASATYSLVARNTGPSTARNVVVTDSLPTGVSATSATFAGGTCTVTGQQVSCTRSTLASGATAEVVLRVQIAATQNADVVNTAAVSSDTPDPAPGNNSSTITTPVIESADLQVVKTVDQRTVVAGTGLTYTISVINNGPSVATATTLSDVLPTGLTYLDSTSTSGTCSATGQTVACTLGPVAPGAPVTVTISARLARGFAGATVSNTATASSPVSDPVPGNNSGSVTSTVTTSADISIAKTAAPSTLVPGTTVTYTLTTTNQGPSTAAGVVVTDTVPTGITVTSATWGPTGTACSVSGQDVSCALGSVSVGQVNVTIVGTLDSQFVGTSITNVGNVSSTTPDPTTGDQTSTTVSPVAAQADLGLVKTMSPSNPVAGQQVTFTLTATNYGPSAAQNPQFIDQLPAGLTNVSVVPPPGATGCVIIPPVDPGTADNPNAPTVTCSGPIFRAGFTVAGTITATVTPGFTGVLTNTGRTSSDTIDPVASNNESTVSGVVGRSADVSITKTVSPAAPVPGQPVTYTLTARNDGPSTATGVTVTDAVPAALTGVTASTSAGSCTVTGNDVSCSIGTMAPSATQTVTVTGTLRPDFTGTLTNTAAVSSTTPDADTSNNSATSSVSVAPSADLSIVKSIAPATPVPGQQVRFSLQVRNNGPSTATGVTVNDDLSAALVGASATSTAGTCSINASNSLSCAVGSLAPSATATVTVTATLSPNTTGALTNTARVTSPVNDPDPTNNVSSVSGNTAPSADLSVAKSMSPTAPIPGSAIGYTITVRNAGPSTATGVSVADQLNPAIGQVTATVDNGTTCTLSTSNALTCPVGSVAPGGVVTVSVTATLAPTFTGALTNTATVTAATADPNTANNSSTVTGTAAPSADLSMSKSMAPTVPVPGQPLRFILSVRNAGPSTATGVTVSDQLDPALQGASATVTAGTCSISTSNLLSCTLGSLAPDGTVTVTVTTTLAAGFTGTLSNTASVASPTPDPVPANNRATVTGDGAPSADVAVTKTISPTTPVPGQRVVFTMTVTNNGPSTARAVTLADQLNTALGDATVTTTAGTCAVGTDNALFCSLNAVAPGDTVTVRVSALLASTYTGSLSNTVTVTSPTADPNTANNRATASGSSAPSADVSVTKTMSPANPVPGRPVTFTLTVRNAGPSTATAVSVADQVNQAVTGTTATTSRGTCAVDASNALTCALGSMAPGSTATITLTGTLAPGFTGTLANTATTSTTTSDPDSTNNTSSVSGATAPSADLSITKSMSPTAPIPGSAVSFTMVVRNAGPSTASSAALTDQLDPALSSVTATADNQSTCAVSASNLLTCPLGTLAPGAVVTVSVTATLSSGFTGVLSNTARITSPTTDPDPTNNAATVSGTAAPSADVSVTKTMSPAAPVPGQPVTFTMVVRNTGPSTAAAVTLDDQLAAALSGATVSTTAGTCTVNGSNALGCALGTVTRGATATVTVTANLDAGFTGTLSNTATAGSATPDPDTTNNSATATGVAAASANVSITKTMTPSRPVPGQPVTFVMTVRNAGPSTATAVTITDQVDSAVTGLATTTTTGSCAAGTDNAVACALGDLVPGATASVTVTGTLDPAYTGTLTNTATVTSPTPDSIPADNTSTTSGTAAPSADVSITKTMSPATPVAGDPVTFTVTVRNAGPSDARAVIVSDTLDPALRTPTASTTRGTCTIAGRQLTCAVGDLTASASPAVITVTSTVAPDFTGTLANTATVSATTPDPNPANNSATATGGSTASADVSITKTMSPTVPVPGTPISYSLVVHNDGPSTATGVVVSDRLDAAITAITATADDGSTCTVAAGNLLTCPLAPLDPAGVDVTISVTGSLAANFTGQLTNTATVAATTPDPDPGDNRATVTGVAAPSADVAVTKTISPAAPVPGQPVTWTVTTRNTGPSTAVDVITTDQVTSALTGVVATPTSGSCAVSPSNLVTCTAGALTPGASSTVTIRGTLDPAFTGTLSNTAAASAATPDPVATNNRATVDAVAAPSADVSVTKRMTPLSPVPGEVVTYSLSVHNDGPSTAADVTLSDVLPAELTGATVSTTNGSCTITAGNSVACALGALGPDANASVTVRATLAPDFTGSLSNTATATSPTPDPVAANNSSTVTGASAASADVSITKTLGPAAPVPGQEVTFTLTVDNAGPSTAADVVVTDVLDPALLDVDVQSSVGTCDVDGSRTLTCDLGAVDPSDPAISIVITATLAPDFTGTLSNTAQVASPTPDPNTLNNVAEVSGASTPQANLSITKVVNPTAPVPGESVTYTITVDNAGSSTATGVTVTDSLDAALSSATATTSRGTCSVTDGVLSCSLGDVSPADAAITIEVTADLASDFLGTLGNTATVSSPTPDPDEDDNTATASGITAPSADLAVTKTMSPASVVPGEQITFTMTVVNDGPSDAASAVLTDQLDPRLSAVSFTTTSGTCVLNAGLLTCSLGAVAAGSPPIRIAVSATLAEGSTGELANTASVTSSTPDPDSDDNAATVTGTITPTADLRIAKSVNPSPVVPGGEVRFTITVDNAGPSTARQVVVTDQLPEQLGSVRVTTTAGTCDPVGADRVVTCSLGSLATTSAPAAVTVTAVLADTFSGTLTNTAEVSSATPDPEQGNNTATATAEASPAADLTLTKTAASAVVVAGENASYSITIRNGGPSTAVDVTMTDLLPAQLGAGTATTDTGTCTVTGGRAVQCDLGDLAPGSEAVVLVTAAVAPTATGSITNTATAAASTPDPDGEPATDTALVDVVPDTDLVLTKTVSAATVTTGDIVTYTLRVTASGPSTASAVTVVDTLPRGLVLVGRPDTDTGTCTSGSTIRCALGDLDPGASVSISLRARVTATSGTIVNRATVSSALGDRNPANDVDSAGMDVEPAGGSGTPEPPPSTPPPPNLPWTGVDLATQLWFAFALLVAGCVLVLGSRRRGRGER